MAEQDGETLFQQLRRRSIGRLLGLTGLESTAIEPGRVSGRLAAGALLLLLLVPEPLPAALASGPPGPVEFTGGPGPATLPTHQLRSDTLAQTTMAAIQADTAEAFAGYIEELQLAGPNWETKPASGEGEDAWCARQVAEHLAGAATFFAAGIAFNLKLDGPERAPAVLPTVDEAVAATKANHAALVKVMAQVSDEQLDQEVVAPQLGGNVLLERVVTIIPAHLRDHTNQLRTLRGG